MKSEEKRESGLGTPPEARLLEQAQKGCEASLDLLLVRHEPLVIHATSRQNLGDLPYEEAVQAGRIGLWKAILGYDPQRGYQFSTYAYPAIVHHVWAAVKSHCQANSRAHGLREWVLILPHWEASAAQRQAERELQACLGSMLAGMPDRLGHVIRRRYALDGEPRQTLAEMGRELGVCGERVRQLQVEALIWLRHPAHSQDLRTLLRRHSQQAYEWVEEVAQAWRRQRAGRHGQA